MLSLYNKHLKVEKIHSTTAQSDHTGNIIQVWLLKGNRNTSSQTPHLCEIAAFKYDQ